MKRACTGVMTLTKLFGVLAALGHGVMMALVPLPTLFTDEYTAGVKFLPSMAVGCLLVYPLTCTVLFATTPLSEFVDTLCSMEVYKVRTCMVPGLLAGIIWGCGNISGIYAFQYIEFFLVIAFVQCNSIVSEVYGIFCYKELTRFWDIVFFVLCSFCIVIGCALLAVGVYE